MSQCGQISISYVDSVCLGDEIVIESSGVGSSLSEIDLVDIIADSIITLDPIDGLQGTLSDPRSITIVKEDSLYYGFVKNPNLTSLVRLEFGTSLNNTPTIHPITNQSSSSLAITTRSDMKFVKANGTWHALTTLTSARIGIMRFENGLSSDTISTSLYFNATHLYQPADLDIEIVNDSIYAIVLSRDGKVAVLNFGDTLDTPISISSTDVFASTDLSNGRCIEVIHQCGQFTAFVTGITRNKLCKLDYGNSLLNTPTYTVEETGVNTVNNITSYQSEGGFQIWTQHSFQGIRRFDYDSTLNTMISQNTFNPNNNLRGTAFDIVNDSGVFKIVSYNSEDSAFRQIIFHEPNLTSVGFSKADTTNATPLDSGSIWMSVRRVDEHGMIRTRNVKSRISPTPVVSFGVDLTCLGNTTQFSDSSASLLPIQSWSWDFGDGSTSSAQHANHVYLDTGFYSVTLEVENQGGCSNIDSQQVYISSYPVANFATTIPCQGQNLELSDISTVAGYSYIDSVLWVINASDTSYGINTEALFLDTGIQSISQIVYTNYGCQDQLDSSIHIQPSPIADITISSTCFGDSVIFTNQTSSIESYTDLWQFGDGDSSLQYEPQHQYLDTGFYTITYAATSTGQCSDTLESTIRISNQPSYSLHFPEDNICAFEKNLFSDSSIYIDGYTGIWVNNLDTHFGNSFLLESVIASNNNLIDYSSVTGTDCRLDTTFIYNVIEGPRPSFDVSSLCVDQFSQFINTSQIPSNQSISNITWTFDNSLIPGFDTAVVLTNDSGTFALNLEVVTDSNCLVTLDTSIRVVQKPIVSLSILEPICSYTTAETSLDISTDKYDSLQNTTWLVNFAQKIDTFSDLSSLYLSDFENNVKVRLVIETKSGCVVTDSQIIDITESPRPSIAQSNSCYGELVTLACGYDGTNYLASWYIDSSVTINGLEVQYIFNEPGVYPVSIDLKDISTGCETSTQDSVTVSGFNETQILATGLCKGSLGTFSYSTEVIGDSIYRSAWKIGNENRLGDSISALTGSSDLLIGTLRLESEKGCEQETEFEFQLADSVKFNRQIDVTDLTVDFDILIDDTFKLTNALWVFNGSDSTLSPSGTHVFGVEGESQIFTMVEFNNSCRYLMNESYLIGESSPNVKLIDFVLREKDEAIELEALVQNKGLTAISELNFHVSSVGNAPTYERKTYELQPGEIDWINLSTTFSLGYSDAFCLSINSLDEIPFSSDTLCDNLMDELFIGDFFPNPGNGKPTVIITTQDNRSFAISTFDSSGKLRDAFELITTKGTNLYRLDFSSMSTGIYLIKFESEQDVIVRKIVIQ